VEESGVKWSGVEWSGVKWSGVALSVGIYLHKRRARQQQRGKDENGTAIYLV